MDLQIPDSTQDMDAAVAALMQQASKDALASYARGKCGAKFDDARTSKADIARMILTHHAQQRGESVPEQQPKDDAAEAILAQAVKCGYLSEMGANNWREAFYSAPRTAHDEIRSALRSAVDQHMAEHRKEASRPKEQPKVAPEQKNAQNVAQAIAAALATVKLGVDPEEIRAAVREEMKATADLLREEITKQVFRVEVKVPTGEVRDVGTQHKKFADLVRAVAIPGINVWLVGPAASGKTTAAENVAKALGLSFYFNGAIDTEYKLLGFTDAQGRIVSTAFRKAYEEGGVYLFDEVDASLPAALLAFNAALANGYADFPGGMVKRHPDFRCIAAANTWGLGGDSDYVGRNKMDAAFLNRFVRIAWDYDETLERSISGNDGWTSFVQTMRAKAKAKGLKVVISPRASIYGAQLLAAGFNEATVKDMTVFAGLTPEQRKNIENA